MDKYNSIAKNFQKTKKNALNLSLFIMFFWSIFIFGLTFLIVGFVIDSLSIKIISYVLMISDFFVLIGVIFLLFVCFNNFKTIKFHKHKVNFLTWFFWFPIGFDHANYITKIEINNNYFSKINLTFKNNLKANEKKLEKTNNINTSASVTNPNINNEKLEELKKQQEYFKLKYEKELEMALKKKEEIIKKL